MNTLENMVSIIRKGIKNDENFHALTTEVSKIDRHKIQEYRENGYNLSDIILPWATKKEWGITHHFNQRVRDYHNKPMKYFASVELNDFEYSVMSNPIKFKSFLKWIFKNRYISLTEVGFNSLGQICKSGVIMPAPGNKDLSGSRNNKGRLLFICLGANHYIKTWYITEGDKYRENYQSSNPSVKYVR